jgi:hypothetical protein
MCVVGVNGMVRGNEPGNPMRGTPHLHGNPHQLVVGMIHIFPTSILYNHVMHDDTSDYDIPKALLVPKSSRPLTMTN